MQDEHPDTPSGPPVSAEPGPSSGDVGSAPVETVPDEPGFASPGPDVGPGVLSSAVGPDPAASDPVPAVSGPALETGGQRPSVGHPEVDAVLERLDELDVLETADHPEVYEDAHSRLHQVLIAAGRDASGPGAETG